MQRLEEKSNASKLEGRIINATMTSGKMQEGLEKQEQYKKEQEGIHDMIVFANLLKYAEIVVSVMSTSWPRL